MANIPSWRMHLPKTKVSPEAVSDVPDVMSSNQHRSVPLFTPASLNPPHKSKTRAIKSLSSFASYLNPRSQSESFREGVGGLSPFHSKDANSSGKDEYRANLPAMCNAIRQFLLMNPSQGLPPSYNSAILQVIEAYETAINGGLRTFHASNAGVFTTHMDDNFSIRSPSAYSQSDLETGLKDTDGSGNWERIRPFHKIDLITSSKAIHSGVSPGDPAEGLEMALVPSLHEKRDPNTASDKSEGNHPNQPIPKD